VRERARTLLEFDQCVLTHRTVSVEGHRRLEELFQSAYLRLTGAVDRANLDVAGRRRSGDTRVTAHGAEGTAPSGWSARSRGERTTALSSRDGIVGSRLDHMNIGRPKRIIEVEPAQLPVPETLPEPLPASEPDREPAPADPAR